MFTKTFLKAVLERAIKTFAQVLAALLASNATGILDADWQGALSVAGLAAIVSVLTSVATGALTDGSPSIANAEVIAE